MIITPNIKARRLIYLKLIFNFLKFDSGDKYNFSGRFLEFCNLNNPEFNKNLKGKVYGEKGPKSILPYIDLAFELDLIKKQGKCIFWTNETTLNFTCDNSSFNCSEKNALYWLLVEKDPLGLFLAFCFLGEEETLSYKKLKSISQDFLLELISRFEEGHFLMSYLSDIAGAFLKKISLDSCLLPRVNWFYDIGLLDLEYKSSEKGNYEELFIYPNSICTSTSRLLRKSIIDLKHFESKKQFSKLLFEKGDIYESEF